MGRTKVLKPLPPVQAVEPTQAADDRRHTVRIKVSEDDGRRRAIKRKAKKCENCRKPFYFNKRQPGERCERCEAEPDRFTNPYGLMGLVIFDSQWQIDKRQQYGLPLEIPPASVLYTQPLGELNDERHRG